jgi:hypothetical protein
VPSESENDIVERRAQHPDVFHNNARVARRGRDLRNRSSASRHDGVNDPSLGVHMDLSLGVASENLTRRREIGVRGDRDADTASADLGL